MQFNGVELTQKSIEETKQYFIDLNYSLIESAKNKEFHVNDLDRYILWKLDSIKMYESGDLTRSFTFLQRAYFFQTGETIALLK